MMMSGCSDIQEYEAPVEEVFKTFYAEMETNQATKTVLGQKGENGIRQVLWLPSDMIGVVPTGVGNQFDVFTNTVKESSIEAIFEGQTILADSYYAIYPYNEADRVIDYEIDFRLSAVQNYKEGTFDSGAFPMVARSKDSDSDGLQFLNLCGVLELNLTGEVKISSITFSSDNEVSGYFSVDMNYVDYPKIVSSSNSSKFVTLNCGSGVQLNPDTPVPFYIVLPPGEYNGFNLLIKTTDGKVMCKDAKKPLDIKRSYVKSTGALPYVGVESVNLSLNGTSNCYMVSSFGSYTFDASVKGNSIETVGVPVSAEVVWETKNTDQAVSTGDIVRNVSYNGGSVFFESTGVEGNALIAVKDASGKILWSWHIWATDYEPNTNVNVYLSGALMMDRNLGALDCGKDASSYGFLYQWGRKDPLIGSGTGSTVFATTAPANVKQYVKPSSSFEYSFANPTHSIGNLYNNSTAWGRTKTMYDPCPPGWRVPDGGPDGVWSGMVWGIPGIVGTSSSGYWIINPPYSTPATIYPAPGYTGGDRLELYWPHQALYCWSCDAVSNSSNNAYGMHLFNRIERELTSNRNSEFSVRCMREHAINVSLNTLPATDVTRTSATLHGSMEYIGTAEVSDMGFVWSSTNTAPDITCSKVSVGVAAGEFSASLTELKSGMTYYYRTFVTENGITIYGPVLSFTTQTSAGNEDIPEGDEYEW